MALFTLKVPPEVAKSLGGLPVPGEKTPHDESHVSLVYLGDNVPMSTVFRAIEAAYNVASNASTIIMSTNRVETFPPGEDGRHAVIARLDSRPLHLFREALCRALDSFGVEYSKKFPTFKPHVTISYSPVAVETHLIQPIVWTATEMVMWAGDHGEERLSVVFPFAPQSMGPTSLDSGVMNDGVMTYLQREAV